MWLKKSSIPIHDPKERVSAIVMPHPGHSDDEVADFFAHRGIADIGRLSPGFLSVEAPRDVLKDAESVARVEEKRPKQPR
jgi:hypothetical protein